MAKNGKFLYEVEIEYSRNNLTEKELEKIKEEIAACIAAFRIEGPLTLWVKQVSEVEDTGRVTIKKERHNG